MNVLFLFHRDLRAAGNDALAMAGALARDMGGAVLPLFIVDPADWTAPNASARQWEGMRDALGDLRAALAELGAPLVLRMGPKAEVLARLVKSAKVTAIVAHENPAHLDAMAWARAAGLDWHAARPADKPLPAPDALPALSGLEIGPIPSARALRLADDPCPHRQNAGRAQGLLVLDSFLARRAGEYAEGRVDPLRADRASSRLSPYLSLGSLGMAEVRSALVVLRSAGAPAPWRPSLAAFQRALSLRARADFAQAAPQACAISPSDPARLAAWSTGQTGFPYIDAMMRCLNASGWAPHAARAQLFSFAAANIGLDWQVAGAALAQKFTDYDPSIHWQAVRGLAVGMQGKAPRGPDPVRLGLTSDPLGQFTRRWLPELAGVPDTFLQCPWRFAGARQILGRRYPEPMVDVTLKARQWQTPALAPLPARKSAPHSGQMVMEFSNAQNAAQG